MMEIDEDTCAWLGCSTPLEMYKHQCVLLEGEMEGLQLKLRKAQENIRGLIQMNDDLSASKALVEAAFKNATAEIASLNSDISDQRQLIIGLPYIKNQNEYLFRENQRLLLERAAGDHGTSLKKT